MLCSAPLTIIVNSLSLDHQLSLWIPLCADINCVWREFRDVCDSSLVISSSCYQYGGQTDSQNKYMDTTLGSSTFPKHLQIEPCDYFWLVIFHRNSRCHFYSKGLQSRVWWPAPLPVIMIKEDLQPSGYLGDCVEQSHLLVHRECHVNQGQSFVVKLLNCVRLFCKPRGCSPLGSSVHGISQARIQEWIISFSKNKAGLCFLV